MHLSYTLPVSKEIFAKVLYYALFLSVIIRICFNLAYNSPFNDEAIYIVLGKLGVFQNDWTSYDAISWASGWEYIYPAITAIAYQTYGIIGSRLLNTLFGLMMLEVSVRFITKISKAHSMKIYSIASLLVLFLG